MSREALLARDRAKTGFYLPGWAIFTILIVGSANGLIFVSLVMRRLGVNPKMLAAEFDVSEAAMRIRLGLPPEY